MVDQLSRPKDQMEVYNKNKDINDVIKADINTLKSS